LGKMAGHLTVGIKVTALTHDMLFKMDLELLIELVMDLFLPLSSGLLADICKMDKL
jgi:hypothetical protein